MNKENILAVADAIEKHSLAGLGFNMCDYVTEADDDTVDRSGHSCGTVACIAGWSVAVKRARVPRNWSTAAYHQARRFLGLGRGEAETLFLAIGYNDYLSDIAPSQAVAVLRHLAETGKVDWSVASKALSDAVGE